MTYVNSSCFNFYRVFLQNFEEKRNQFCFLSYHKRKKDSEKLSSFSNKHWSNYNEPGETELRKGYFIRHLPEGKCS